MVKRRPLEALAECNENAQHMAILALGLTGHHHGSEKSAKRSQNLEMIEESASLLQVLPYTAKVSKHDGAFCGDLAKAGQSIGVKVLHIVAHGPINRSFLWCPPRRGLR